MLRGEGVAAMQDKASRPACGCTCEGTQKKCNWRSCLPGWDNGSRGNSCHAQPICCELTAVCFPALACSLPGWQSRGNEAQHQLDVCRPA